MQPLITHVQQPMQPFIAHLQPQQLCCDSQQKPIIIVVIQHNKYLHINCFYASSEQAMPTENRPGVKTLSIS